MKLVESGSTCSDLWSSDFSVHWLLGVKDELRGRFLFHCWFSWLYSSSILPNKLSQTQRLKTNVLDYLQVSVEEKSRHRLAEVLLWVSKAWNQGVSQAEFLSTGSTRVGSICRVNVGKFHAGDCRIHGHLLLQDRRDERESELLQSLTSCCCCC